jgi:hypothetical protein
MARGAPAVALPDLATSRPGVSIGGDWPLHLDRMARVTKRSRIHAPREISAGWRIKQAAAIRLPSLLKGVLQAKAA